MIFRDTVYLCFPVQSKSDRLLLLGRFGGSLLQQFDKVAMFIRVFVSSPCKLFSFPLILNSLVVAVAVAVAVTEAVGFIGLGATICTP